jgi:hypothetical protein
MRRDMKAISLLLSSCWAVVFCIKSFQDYKPIEFGKHSDDISRKSLSFRLWSSSAQTEFRKEGVFLYAVNSIFNRKHKNCTLQLSGVISSVAVLRTFGNISKSEKMTFGRAYLGVARSIRKSECTVITSVDFLYITEEVI